MTNDINTVFQKLMNPQAYFNYVQNNLDHLLANMIGETIVDYASPFIYQFTGRTPLIESAIISLKMVTQDYLKA